MRSARQRATLQRSADPGAQPPSAPPPPAASLGLRAPIASDTLFAGATEVQIAHRGAVYRLKQTALGKLILTK